MYQVQPYQLWIGNAGDARDATGLLDLGLKAVLQLSIEEPILKLPREVIYCRLPLLDGGGNDPFLVRMAIEEARLFLQTSMPTLVACGGGMSRSPAIVAAALALVERTPLDACVKRITAGVAHDISPALWSDVRTVYGGR